MADDIPHDRASPKMEVDPKFEPLPLSVRPFDPATYHPEIHVLPPDSLPGVTFISWHLRGDSCAIRGYETTSAREWYMELPDDVRHIINEASFGSFRMGLSCLIASRPLLGALEERWWNTTDSFHFSTVEEMTMTPFDFSMLTSIKVGVGGRSDLSAGDSATYLPIKEGLILLVCRQLKRDGSYNPRGDRAVCPRFSDVLRPGGPIPCPTLRLGRRWLGHHIRLWVYAYFSRLVPKPEVDMPPVVPYSHRYNMRFKDQFAGARENSRFLLLFECPVCWAWFLGERFLRQTIAWPTIEKYTLQEMIDFMRAWDADFFLVEGDYTAFIQTYLRPPLTGARGGERARAPTMGERGRGAGVTRTHGRRGSGTRQRIGWPELPATLTY
ncbi:hypothetical protein CsSME_00008531 [Camellia sinensis var. sinensis]